MQIINFLSHFFNVFFFSRKNVCTEREETTDDEQNEDGNDEKGKNKTGKALSNIFSTSISLSNCFESANKYECVTK